MSSRPPGCLPVEGGSLRIGIRRQLDANSHHLFASISPVLKVSRLGTLYMTQNVLPSFVPGHFSVGQPGSFMSGDWDSLYMAWLVYV